MASTESTEAKTHHHHHHSHHPPTTPVPSVACRMLRSPSHESVTTDLSLFSVSSLASDAAAAAAAAGSGGRGMRLVTFKSYSEAQLATRGPSPNPDSRSHVSNRPADIPEILWFEEENELIRSCAALSSALGLQKSFSTSDISQLPSPEEPPSLPPPRCAVSELALSAMQRSGFLMDHPHLDHASRSCSTWVAVGDVASTSQLPSPHGGHSTAAPSGAPSAATAVVASATASTAPSGAAAATAAAPTAPLPIAPAPAFTAADLIRSVNKKVRQNYIRRRLLTTYKALERLSQSEFNLDRLEVTPATAAATAAATASAASGAPASVAAVAAATAVPGAGAGAPAGGSGVGAGAGGALATHLTVPGAPPSAGAAVAAVAAAAASANSANCTSAAVLRVVKQRASKNLPLTIRDVERERGKPLSKYERNMMIFNWLHTLDDSFEGLQ